MAQKDFTGSPEVKTLTMHGGWVQCLVGDLRSNMPSGQKKLKHENISNVVTHVIKTLKMLHTVTSLVAPWIRIHLSMQGMHVRSRVWEDSNCQASVLQGHAPELLRLCAQLMRLVCLGPVLCNEKLPQGEAMHYN